MAYVHILGFDVILLAATTSPALENISHVSHWSCKEPSIDTVSISISIWGINNCDIVSPIST